jgi:HAD superfamily hydrolase (TIGR01549 family)
MIPSFPVYLFDLDGTLMDSAADINGAILDVLASRGHAGASDVHLRRYIGRHLLDTFGDLGFSGNELDDMITEYRRVYPLRCHAGTRVFPGIPEMLAHLSGRKSTATTKSSTTTRLVLEQFGLLSHFDHVQGTDGFPAKPAPDVIFESLRWFGAPAGDCLFVGDSPADMEAGRRAGVRTCAVRWGYGDHAEMARWNPDYWIDEPADLIRNLAARRAVS